MKVSFKGILEGAWNSIFVKESIEETHRERIDICRECPYNSTKMKEQSGYKTFRPDFHCTICGCNLDMKTRAMSEKCPQDKWLAVISDEEEKIMIDKLKEDYGERSKS